MGQWGKIFIEGGRKLGVSFEVVQNDLQRKAMETAGFVNIQVKDIKARIPFPASTFSLSNTDSP